MREIPETDTDCGVYIAHHGDVIKLQRIESGMKWQSIVVPLYRVHELIAALQAEYAAATKGKA